MNLYFGHWCFYICFPAGFLLWFYLPVMNMPLCSFLSRLYSFELFKVLVILCRSTLCMCVCVCKLETGWYCSVSNWLWNMLGAIFKSGGLFSFWVFLQSTTLRSSETSFALWFASLCRGITTLKTPQSFARPTQRQQSHRLSWTSLLHKAPDPPTQLKIFRGPCTDPCTEIMQG